MEIYSLKNFDFDTVYKAFELAFIDYEVRFEKEEVRRMLKRRGFDSDLSFAAFDKGKIVAFTLNGIGSYGGILTAYDTGTGTLGEYRGKGLAKRIFEYSIPYLREAGVQQYLLEVMTTNKAAISVYRKMGFEVSREFGCYRSRKNEVAAGVENLGFACSVERVDLSVISSFPGFCDFSPSWQNGYESVARADVDLVCLGAFFGSEMMGYIIFDSSSGDLTQIAVNRDYRRKGIASRLLNGMLEAIEVETVKALNVDLLRGGSLVRFLCSRGIKESGRQFEMIKPI